MIAAWPNVSCHQLLHRTRCWSTKIASQLNKWHTNMAAVRVVHGTSLPHHQHPSAAHRVSNPAMKTVTSDLQTNHVSQPQPECQQRNSRGRRQTQNDPLGHTDTHTAERLRKHMAQVQITTCCSKDAGRLHPDKFTYRRWAGEAQPATRATPQRTNLGSAENTARNPSTC